MRSRVLVAALMLMGLLAGCSSDPATDSDGSPSPTGTASPTAPPTTAPSQTEPTSPSVTPASGPAIVITDLDTPVLRLRLPDEVKWGIHGGGGAATSDFLDPGYADISGRGTPLVPGKGLAYYARSTAETVVSLGPDVKRVSDRTVAGFDGFVLEGKDSSGFAYVFGTVYGEVQVDVIFEFPRDNARARGWIESILASAEWV